MNTARHSNSRAAARAFLESIFSEVGSELSFSDISTRAIKAGVASSTSVINNVCVTMTDEKFLTRRKKGVYSRTDPRGTALPMPEPPKAPAPPSQEALDVVRLAGIDSRLIGLATKIDGLQSSVDQILALLLAPK